MKMKMGCCVVQCNCENRFRGMALGRVHRIHGVMVYADLCIHTYMHTWVERGHTFST